jgi:hypothetical protein
MAVKRWQGKDWTDERKERWRNGVKGVYAISIKIFELLDIRGRSDIDVIEYDFKFQNGKWSINWFKFYRNNTRYSVWEIGFGEKLDDEIRAECKRIVDETSFDIQAFVKGWGDFTAIKRSDCENHKRELAREL